MSPLWFSVSTKKNSSVFPRASYKPNSSGKQLWFVCIFFSLFFFK